MGSALNSTALTSQVRAMAAAEPGLGEDPLVSQAWQAGVSWLGSSTLDSQLCPDGKVAMGHGDCNLANFLWDGTQVRIVDFEDSGSAAIDHGYSITQMIALARELDPGLEGRDFAEAGDRLDRLDDEVFARYELDASDVAHLRDRFADWPRTGPVSRDEAF